MKWVGITGGIASGKSSISQHLVSRGFVVISADQIVRELSEPGESGYQKIVQYFGKEILTANGFIDRKKLGSRVFRSSEELQQLENILHPLVRDLVEKKRKNLQQQGHKVAFYEVPLLFEKQLEKNFDVILLVSADMNDQLQRIMKRDGLSREEALLRLKAQLPDSEKVKKSHYILRNSASLESLQKETDLVLQKILGHE